MTNIYLESRISQSKALYFLKIKTDLWYGWNEEKLPKPILWSECSYNVLL